MSSFTALIETLVWSRPMAPTSFCSISMFHTKFFSNPSPKHSCIASCKKKKKRHASYSLTLCDFPILSHCCLAFSVVESSHQLNLPYNPMPEWSHQTTTCAGRSSTLQDQPHHFLKAVMSLVPLCPINVVLLQVGSSMLGLTGEVCAGGDGPLVQQA